MKRLWIFLFLPLMACNDWLNITSENDTTLTGYFKNEQEVESWMYSVFNSERGLFTLLSYDRLDNSGLICTDGGYYEGHRRLDPVFCMDIRGGFKSDWDAYYSTIYLAQMLIDNRHRFKGITDERADFWLAQANFVKALMYFDLARRWGEVPILGDSESTEAEPKQPVDVVLAEAIRCAEEALILPPYEELRDCYGSPVTSKQYASIGTVHTLLANIYAWMGGLYGKTEYWEKAETEASLVIDGQSGDYQLEKDIDLMLKNCLGSVRNSKETIFDMELNELDEDYTYTLQFCPYYPGQQLIDYPYLSSNPFDIENNADAMKITVEKVKEVYPETADQRRRRYWYKLGEVGYRTSSGDSITSEYAFLDKWNEARWQTSPEMQEDYTGIILMKGNKVMWRLADVILLRAECRARLGKATAKDDLNRVRERAGLREYAGSTDFETLRKEIFRERERELFGEGHRYFDIVRNGYVREELEGNYKTLTDEDIRNGALYLPVAMSGATIKNPYMTQNTYWLWQQ